MKHGFKWLAALGLALVLMLSLDYAKILGDAWHIRTRTENLKYITEKIEEYERN